VERERAEHRLDGPGRAEHVPGDRFRGGDRQPVRMLAEDELERAGLGGITKGCRRAVRVDVADALRLDARAADRGAHHHGHADGLRLGLRHVVRVVRGAVGEHLGVDAGSPRPRGLEVLEDEDAGALAHHEAGPGGVEGPGRKGRVLLLGDEPAHRAEAGQDQRVDARLGAAREHDVGIAAPDELGRLPDRVRARRAGRDGRVVRASEAERDGELAARGVDEYGRDEERRHPVGAALEEHAVLLGDPRQAADRRADEDARAIPIDALDAGVGPRLPRGAERKQDVAVELPRLLGGGDGRRIEPLHLGGDPDGEAVGVERLDEADAAPAGLRSRPGGGCVEPERSDRPEPRDRDTSHAGEHS
jgi:hypothetical protein